MKENKNYTTQTYVTARTGFEVSIEFVVHMMICYRWNIHFRIQFYKQR